MLTPLVFADQRRFYARGCQPRLRAAIALVRLAGAADGAPHGCMEGPVHLAPCPSEYSVDATATSSRTWLLQAKLGFPLRCLWRLSFFRSNLTQLLLVA